MTALFSTSQVSVTLKNLRRDTVPVLCEGLFSLAPLPKSAKAAPSTGLAMSVTVNADGTPNDLQSALLKATLKASTAPASQHADSLLDALLDRVTLILKIDALEAITKTGKAWLTSTSPWHIGPLTQQPKYKPAHQRARRFPTLDIPNFSLGYGPLVAHGEIYHRQGKLNASLDFEKLDLLTLQHFLSPTSPFIALRGRLTGHLKLSETVDNPHVQLNFRAEDIVNALMPPSRRKKYTAEVDLSLQDSLLRLKANLDTPNQATLGLHGEVDIAPYLTGSAGTDHASQGVTLTGQLSVKGPLDLYTWSSLVMDPDTWLLKGTLLTDATLILTKGIPSGRGTFELFGPQLQYVPIGLQLNRSTTTLPHQPSLTAKLGGNRLTLSGTFSDKLPASSSATSSPSQTPRSPDTTSPPLTIDGTVVLTPAQGETMSGAWGVEPNLRLTFNKFWFMRNPTFDMAASGDLTLTRSIITGSLAIDPSIIYIPTSSTTTLDTVDVVLKTKSGTQNLLPLQGTPPTSEDTSPSNDVDGDVPPPSPTQMTSDIKITSDGTLRVRGYGLNTLWGGEITITGPLNAPTADGSITLRRGTLSLFGRQFAFNHGIMTLTTNANTLGVFFDAQAQATISDVITQIHLYGDLSSVKLNLSSTPVLPQSEILSYLLFGNKSATLSPFQAVELANTVSEFTNGNAGTQGLMGQLRDSLGLSSLSLNMSDETPSLEIGQYVTDDVYLKLNQDINQEGTTASLQYDLNKYFTLETQAGSTGNIGGGVALKFRY